MKTLVLGAVTAALLHITPTVILVKREDAVAKLLPGADQFTARELHLSSTDSRKLHDAVGWEPPDGVVTFYVGKRGDETVGALVFMRVDCQHGPIELAIGYGPHEPVSGSRGGAGAQWRRESEAADRGHARVHGGIDRQGRDARGCGISAVLRTTVGGGRGGKGRYRLLPPLYRLLWPQVSPRM